MQPRILVVDDQPLVLGAIQEILSRGPYLVLSATCAEDALKVMENDHIDVVISDERMPGIPGSEFLAIARQRYPNTVRIILTGHASVESTIRAINEAEIYRLLTKPVGCQDLLNAVKDGLEVRDKGQTSEQAYSLLDNLEKQAPGITQVQRDDDGVVIIDENET